MQKLMEKLIMKMAELRAVHLARKFGKKIYQTTLIGDGGVYLGSLSFYDKEDMIAVAQHILEQANKF